MPLLFVDFAVFVKIGEIKIQPKNFESLNHDYFDKKKHEIKFRKKINLPKSQN